MALLADTHAHLDLKQFNPDREEVIRRARQAGIGLIINAAINEDSSRDAIELAERYPEVYAAVGVHPHDTAKASAATIEKLAVWAGHPRVVAVGETGFDFYRRLSPPEVQEWFFREQLRLAVTAGKPVIIHTREAYTDTLRVLQEETLPERPGVMHCFSGNASQAAAFLELGFYISLAGPVTYPAARELRSLLKVIPPEKLLLETDAPFLPPQPHRGRRNEPSFITATYRRVAVDLDLDPGKVAEQVWENAHRLFSPEPVSCPRQGQPGETANPAPGASPGAPAT